MQIQFLNNLFEKSAWRTAQSMCELAEDVKRRGPKRLAGNLCRVSDVTA